MFSQLFYLGAYDTATPQANILNWFHGEVMFFLICICVLVLVLIAEILSDFWLTFNYPVNVQELQYRETILEGVGFTHSSRLEVFWITLPSFVLFLIAFPSLDLLYTFDEIYGWSVCFKAIGHQWYWSYELSGLLKVR